MHVFLDAGHGNALAFFELPTQPPMDGDPNTPPWVQHIAFVVRDRADLLEFKAHFEARASMCSVSPTTAHSIPSTSSTRTPNPMGAPIGMENAEAHVARLTLLNDWTARQPFGCHLAEGFRMGETVHETSDSTWELLFDVSVRPLINIASAVVPDMIAGGGGKIVSAGAFAAQKGIALMGAYCASRSSVMRLTEAMSTELNERNINVNCVLPTIIDTPDNRAAMPDADPTRWVSPQAVADVIAFLASASAREFHRAALPVTSLS